MKQHSCRTLAGLLAAVVFGCAPLVRSVADEPPKASTTKPLPIRLGKSVQGRVEGNLLLASVTFPTTFKGKLVYSRIGDSLPLRRYLVLTQVGHQGEEQVATTSIFPIEDPSGSGDTVFNPRFSPNGQYVLFQWGQGGERQSSFDLYLWNLKTQQLQRITKERIGWSFTLWSPDSSHITYIRNSDGDGYPISAGELELCVYDIKTGQERSIIKNNGVLNSVSWTPQNTLLFNMRSDVPQPKKKKATGAKQEPEPYVEPVYRLDIYEASASGGKPKLIVKHAFQATASPDGKWLTCFGSRDPLKPMPLGYEWWKDSRSTFVLVTKRDGSERRVFGQTDGTYSSVLWLPDSKGFIAVKPLPEAAGAQAEVSKWNIVNPDARKVALLKAEENEHYSRTRSNIEPNFSNLRLNRDGTFLLVNVGELEPFQAGLAQRVDSLQAVDLRSGSILKLCQLKRSDGLDWHEESTATTANTLKIKPNAGAASR